MKSFNSLGLATALALGSVSCHHAASPEPVEEEMHDPGTPPASPEGPTPDPCHSAMERVWERLQRGEGITRDEEEKLKPCLKQEGVELI